MRWLIAALLSFVITPVHASDERQIRRDCTYDALRYCKSSIAEATKQASRQPIIDCMIAHRDKLQSKCSKHLY